MKKKTNPAVSEMHMSEKELSDKLGRYQNRENGFAIIGILACVIGCILAFFVDRPTYPCILGLIGAAAILIAVRSQSKKKALLWQQLGDFFKSELEKAFGKELSTPEMRIDEAFLRESHLVDRLWENCKVENFHEGMHNGLHFSAANVVLQHSFEEKCGSNQDDWMTRTVKMLDGIVIRCKTNVSLPCPVRINERIEEHPCGDLTDPAAFDARYTVTSDSESAVGAFLTPQLQKAMKELETLTGGPIDGVQFADGVLSLAINTSYVFANISDSVDVSDLDAVRKWYILTLRDMGRLLNVLTQNTALF